MSGLLENICAVFSPSLSEHLASRLGESSKAIRRALQGAVPLTLGGIITKAAGDGYLAFRLNQVVYPVVLPKAVAVTEVLIMLGGKDVPNSAMSQSTKLLASLFGSHEEALVDSLSHYARVTPVSARLLLELVGAVLPRTLGYYATTNYLTTHGLVQVLAEEKKRVYALLPPELESWAARTGFQAMPSWPRSRAAGFYAATRQASSLNKRIQGRWYALVAAALVIVGLGIGAVTVEAGQTGTTVEHSQPHENSEVAETAATVVPESR